MASGGEYTVNRRHWRFLVTTVSELTFSPPRHVFVKLRQVFPAQLDHPCRKAIRVLRFSFFSSF
ncbi:MAG: hypothetical protein HND47_15300 [Chloroflexi bacterium]|nr:hypothetical protein [Chloroflexota bacterium]